jgi:hypothetical protein
MHILKYHIITFWGISMAGQNLAKTVPCSLMILEQVVFSLRVGQDSSLFGHIILLEGHSDPISKCDTPSTRAVPADKV